MRRPRKTVPLPAFPNTPTGALFDLAVFFDAYLTQLAAGQKAADRAYRQQQLEQLKANADYYKYAASAVRYLLTRVRAEIAKRADRENAACGPK